MLKIVGNIYSNTKEEFAEIANVLTNAGYQIAYISDNNGSIVKEVESLDET